MSDDAHAMGAFPSVADFEAVRRFFGLKPGVLRTWKISTYTVEERIATRISGMYLYCPCPSWKYGGRKACKHTVQVHMDLAQDVAEGVEK